METTWPCFNINSQAEYSWEKTHVMYLVRSAWCRVLWIAQIERDHYWGSLPTTPLMRLSRALKEKRAHYYSRHDKIILLHDNAWLHVAAPVKTYLETLKWKILPHPPYSPDIAPSDYHLFRSTHSLSEQYFTSYEDTKNCIDDWIVSKDEASFRRGIHMLPERWEKVMASDGHYFE